MKVFQFSLCGWDGGKDGNDDLVKWIKAPDRAALDKFISEQKLHVDKAGIDDDLDPEYDDRDGLDCVINSDGKIISGEIGQTVPDDIDIKSSIIGLRAEDEQYCDTVELAKHLALDEYKAALGSIRLARIVTGYKDDTSIDVRCDPPAIVRITKTEETDIQRIQCEFVDPYWNVELVEPHPKLEGLSSLWVSGPSYKFRRVIKVPGM